MLHVTLSLLRINPVPKRKHNAYWYRQVLQQRKGFGFIAPEDGGIDVFVHVPAVRSGGSLDRGTKVTHDLGEDGRTGKSKAENVSIL
jgi:CspA family cold shock protein